MFQTFLKGPHVSSQSCYVNTLSSLSLGLLDKITETGLPLNFRITYEQFFGGTMTQALGGLSLQYLDKLHLKFNPKF